MLDSSTTLFLVLFLGCLVLSAFFSSAETAFFSSQKLHIRHLASTKAVAGAERVARMMEQPERFLTTVLLGNTFVNTAAASLGTAIALSLIGGERAVLVATGSVTTLLLVFGEIGPKTLAARHGERMALMYGHSIERLMKIFHPVIAIFLWIGDRTARFIAGKPMPRALVSEAEIRTAIMTGVEEGTMEKREAKMLGRVFEFGDRRVAEIMTPRPEIAWVGKGSTLADFLLIYSQTPHSRFPIKEDAIENVVGILWIKDVFLAQAKGEIGPETSVSKQARPAYFIPESKLVKELFTEMQEKGHQMSIVVDEFGGVTGLVTLKQLVEVIVGPVGEEGEPAEEEFTAVDEHTYSVDASMGIAEANERLSLQIPEGDYQTVAGFILEQLGRIPQVGDYFHYQGLRWEVKEMEGVKLERVEVRRVGQPIGQGGV